MWQSCHPCGLQHVVQLRQSQIGGMFDAPTGYQGVRGVVTTSDVHNPKWWVDVGAQPAKDGTLPGYRYVIRKKGEVGSLSCASPKLLLVKEPDAYDAVLVAAGNRGPVRI